MVARALLLSSLALLSVPGSTLAQHGPGRQASKLAPSPRNTEPTSLSRSQSKSLPAKFTNRYRVEFVLIPAGNFMMGSTVGADSEKPVHRVTISQSFYMGKYEVTQWQWRAVMATTVEEQRRKIKSDAASLVARPMAGEGDERATYYASWQEAHTFVERLNALKDGHTYRLPSEAEWEYVCRAGSMEDRTADLNLIAQYKNNTNNYVQPVGMRRPNAFQVYDMIGNVWEWCEDVYHLNYDGAPADGSSWLANNELNQKVKRGGSFTTRNFDYLRCAARGSDLADYRDVETGFRVVATAR
jgi:formylglycine-generating enzyme required for sulfatase activity